MIELAAAKIAGWCQRVSLARIGERFPGARRNGFMELYVVGFAVLLTVVINVASTGAWLCAAVAAYRVIDLVSYRLHFLLVKSKANFWRASTSRRSVILAWVNIYELILAFGTLYLFTGEVKQGGTVLADPMSAAYFSTATLITVGYGDFVPTGTLSRAIVCAELASAVIMLSFILPALFALIAPTTPESSK